ncbi:MAG: DUF4388 domain-containing protein, partial [Deltaproteobacteria bacterium]
MLRPLWPRGLPPLRCRRPAERGALRPMRERLHPPQRRGRAGADAQGVSGGGVPPAAAPHGARAGGALRRRPSDDGPGDSRHVLSAGDGVAARQHRAVAGYHARSARRRKRRLGRPPGTDRGALRWRLRHLLARFAGPAAGGRGRVMALSGTLKDFGIADILQLIGHQTKTGRLMLKTGNDEVEVYFIDGKVVFASEKARDSKDLLGSLLLRAELLNKEQLDDALSMQQRTLKRLGDILLESAVVTRPQLAQMMRLQT